MIRWIRNGSPTPSAGAEKAEGLALLESLQGYSEELRAGKRAPAAGSPEPREILEAAAGTLRQLGRVRFRLSGRMAELALAAEKERLAVTLRSIGDGVITTDMKARISIMNPVAESLTGWAQSDALGRPIGEVFKIVHEHTRLPCENPVEKVLSLDNAVDLANHTVLISRDGTERIIADSGAPIKDRSGKTLGVVLVFHDTTEKEKLTEVTYKVQKLESLGVLAGGIAHDFNNLLGGIFGYLDLARSETDFHTASQHLDKALTTMDRARALTMQLLTFSKGGTPVRKTGRLFPFLRETVQFALSGSNVSCKFDTPDNLWSCSFDQNQISQVFDNLVINAQQAMPLGGVIEVAAKNESLDVHRYPSLPPGKYIRVSVSDHGVGIPRNLINKIFDPFFTTKEIDRETSVKTMIDKIPRTPTVATICF